MVVRLGKKAHKCLISSDVAKLGSPHVESEILARVVKTAAVFRKLGQIRRLSSIELHVKVRLYHSIVVPIDV